MWCTIISQRQPSLESLTTQPLKNRWIGQSAVSLCRARDVWRALQQYDRFIHTAVVIMYVCVASCELLYLVHAVYFLQISLFCVTSENELYPQGHDRRRSNKTVGKKLHCCCCCCSVTPGWVSSPLPPASSPCLCHLYWVQYCSSRRGGQTHLQTHFFLRVLHPPRHAPLSRNLDS